MGNMIKKPFVIVPGPRKCGTTTLSEIIRRHKSVAWPTNMEPDFFILDDITVKNNLGWYLNLYPENNDIFFDGSTHYFHSSRAIRNIHKYIANVKIIIILRDPVKRAHSAFWHMKKLIPKRESRTFEELVENIRGPSIDDIIKSENELLQEAICTDGINISCLDKRMKKKYGELFSPDIEDMLWDFKYFQGSIYSQTVEKWLELYDNVKIVYLEELIEKPKATISEVYDFLGLQNNPDIFELPHINKTLIPKRWISKTIPGKVLGKAILKQQKQLQSSRSYPIFASNTLQYEIEKILNFLYEPRPPISRETYFEAKNILRREYSYWFSKNDNLKYLWKW